MPAVNFGIEGDLEWEHEDEGNKRNANSNLRLHFPHSFFSFKMVAGASLDTYHHLLNLSAGSLSLG